MELRFSGSIQELPASDRLELLVDSVTDYAIYLLDRDGVIRTWNAGAEPHQGLQSRRGHRSAFFAVLYPRRQSGRRAGASSGARRPRLSGRAGGLARAPSATSAL